MAGLPAAGVQYAVGDDSDDPDAADAGDTAAPDMGQVGFSVLVGHVSCSYKPTGALDVELIPL